MFDSDDSLIWQVSRSRNIKEKGQSSENFAKQGKIQFTKQMPSTEGLINASRKNDYDTNFPRKPQVTSGHCAPFSRIENKMSEDITSETGAAEQRFQDSQMHKPCDVAALSHTHTPITGHMSERLYNPKVYSPTHEVVTKETSPNAVKQNSPLTNDINSSTQQHSTLKENISPQARPVWNVVSPHVFNNRPATPPVIKKVKFSKDNFSSYAVETELDHAKKPNVFLRDSSLPQNQSNKETVDPSFPDDRQLQVPMNNRVCTSENVNNRYYSPTSISLPAQAYHSNHILPDRRYNSHVKQGSVYPEPFGFSPQSLNDRFYSPPDPMVYRLIEDQNQQILKLTNTIERILEKQQEDNSPKDTGSREISNSKALHSKERGGDQDNLYKDISTQTQVTSMPEKRCVGVNTDISWNDLIASIRDCNAYDHRGFNSVERPRVTKELNLSDTNRDSAGENVDPDRYQSKQVLSLHRSPVQGPISESTEQEGASLTREIVTAATQEDQPRSHPSLPIGMSEYHDKRLLGELPGHLRNDGKRVIEFGSSVAFGESANTYRNIVQHQNQPTNPNSLPPGGTFYNNVMTNIQQILQGSKALQEERECRQSDKDDHQMSRLVESSTEEIQPDPQIEAVRKQLLQFGISFIDPASRASDPTTILDTMYLPGVHNMLSLYQSTISTHYQTSYQETDATAAKYLTDSQLAAIAAMSPAVTKRNRETGAVTSHGYPIPAKDVNSHERRNQSQLYKFNVNDNFSMATKKFLDRYGLQDD
ncbi:uncharacterized protein [Panulirus ornatus]